MQTQFPEALEQEDGHVWKLTMYKVRKDQLQRRNRKEKTMKKLFISQPMRGLSDEQILVEREKAIKIVKEKTRGRC